MYWLVFITIFLCNIGAGVAGFFLISRCRKITPSTKETIKAASVSVMTVVSFLLITEVCFKEFYAASDSISFTLASHSWFKRYWATNSYGYRDKQHSAGDLTSKKKLFILGDSFAAGQGIDRVQDRFSDILQRRLGEKWVVVNISRCGWSTADEYKALKAYPHKPDILILSYFINDIDSAAKKKGYPRPSLVERPSGPAGFIVNNSYLVNFVYWRLFKLAESDSFEDYFVYLEKIHNNPAIRGAHLEELRDIIALARKDNAKMQVVVFPFLSRRRETSFITTYVDDFFKDNGIEVINISDETAGWDTKDLIASNYDTHPSVKLHHFVAEKIYDRISPLLNR